MKQYKYITIEETRIVPADRMIVSIEMSCDGWYKLQKSKKWKKALKRAEEIEKTNTPMYRQGSQELSEAELNRCSSYPPPGYCPSQPQDKGRIHKIFHREKC